MPKTPEQYEALRQKRRKEIQEAALRLFANEGIHHTSMNSIALEAKISKGLIYNYFKSKKALIHAILLDGFEDFKQAFDRNKDGELSREEFEYFIRESFRIIEQKPDFYLFYFSLLMQPSIVELIQKEYSEIAEPLWNILYQYFAQQGFTNPKIHARVFGALMDGIALHYVMDPHEFNIEETIQVILEKFT